VLVRLGSRGSRLALKQASLAADALRGAGVEIALVPITTAGDRDRTKPFGELGARGVFVKELEEALLGGRIDVAVHSAKDMTSSDTAGLAVGAYLPREDPRDALCGAAGLRPGMRIAVLLTDVHDAMFGARDRVGPWLFDYLNAAGVPDDHIVVGANHPPIRVPVIGAGFVARAFRITIFPANSRENIATGRQYFEPFQIFTPATPKRLLPLNRGRAHLLSAERMQREEVTSGTVLRSCSFTGFSSPETSGARWFPI
jgi:hypothetical protein